MPLAGKGFLRVSLVTNLVSMTAPTTTEINAGIDLTPLLSSFVPNYSEVTADRSPWKSALQVQVPIRYSKGYTLRGYREAQTNEIAWNAIGLFRAQRYLIIRRGPAYATAWTAGQRAEVCRGRLGKRMTQGHSGTNEAIAWEVTFTVTADEDNAMVG